MFPECFKGVSRMFQESFQGVSNKFQLAWHSSQLPEPKEGLFFWGGGTGIIISVQVKLANSTLGTKLDKKSLG